jgi:hypothetical protein
MIRVWLRLPSRFCLIWRDYSSPIHSCLVWSDQIWYIYIYIPRILILGNIRKYTKSVKVSTVYIYIYTSDWDHRLSLFHTFSDLGDKRILIGITWHPVTVTICFWSFSLRASYQASLAASGGCCVPPIPFFTCRKLDPRLRKDLRQNWVLAGSSLLRDRHISTFKCIRVLAVWPALHIFKCRYRSIIRVKGWWFQEWDNHSRGGGQNPGALTSCKMDRPNYMGLSRNMGTNGTAKAHITWTSQRDLYPIT